MSVTGFWIIAAVPSTAVEQLRADLPTPPPEPEDLSWWKNMDDAPLAEPESRGFGRHCPTDAVLRFTDNFEALHPDLDADACMNLLADLTDEDRFVASIRRGDPATTLYYGLGFDASHALPGRFGCFLLTAEEVTTAVPTVEAILTMDPKRRAQAVARMCAWLEVAGDESADFNVEELIDEPLRILLRAKEHGRGAIGLMQWY